METKETLTECLLAWYDSAKRVLPWRSEPTAYRVWVSEIMLQQTQVTTVIPYFERFMQALPDVRALAAVNDDALYKLWQGLGYYSRARNLKRTAQLLGEKYDYRLPDNYQALLSLPGIGPYTAGAIASIAFKQAVPAVDGNVYRVLARVFDDHHDVADGKNRGHFRDLAVGLLSLERPGDFNQALMELGARICTPKGEPRCAQCPINAHCLGFARQTACHLPVKKGKTARKCQQRTVLLLLYAGKVFLQKRPAKGLLAGLWEYPCLEGYLTDDELVALLREKGLDFARLTFAGKAEHQFTHLTWQMRGYFVHLNEAPTVCDGSWASKAELQDIYAVPSAYQGYSKALLQILAQEDERQLTFDW